MDVRQRLDALIAQFRSNEITVDELKAAIIAGAENLPSDDVIGHFNSLVMSSAHDVRESFRKLAAAWQTVSEMQKAGHAAEMQAFERALCVMSAQSGAGPTLVPSAQPHSISVRQAIVRFYDGTAQKYDENGDTRRGQRVAFRFLDEILGSDTAIRSVSMKDAENAIDTLRRIPALHNKNSKNASIDEVISFFEENGDYQTLSEKSVKNHVSNWSMLWKYHMRHEEVDRNIWSGHSFDVKRTRLVVMDWSDENLQRLVEARWTYRDIYKATFAHLVGIAAYSGMRLEEICRLRPQDVVEFEGVKCFHVREHTDPEPWSPKSEAGSRLVPVHSVLRRQEFGLMERIRNVERGGHDYIFGDLSPEGPRSSRGYVFSREFSKFKKRAGIPPNTRFHSFRHTVSTQLQNQEVTIRPLWIDALLGHEGAADGRKKSIGEINYTKRIGVRNLGKAVETIRYPTFFDICRLME
ncbi:tyrosine-type recombinase/integrase [Nguyenibacter vanlangensis]|uniref:Tyrosine-type recombinase/integrase n=1 Tax=Nguyenibacter vanlangensis TaxID=1216886 RepID=A0ABZ3D0T6_9PROT